MFWLLVASYDFHFTSRKPSAQDVGRRTATNEHQSAQRSSQKLRILMSRKISECPPPPLVSIFIETPSHWLSLLIFYSFLIYITEFLPFLVCTVDQRESCHLKKFSDSFVACGSSISVGAKSFAGYKLRYFCCLALFATNLR